MKHEAMNLTTTERPAERQLAWIRLLATVSSLIAVAALLILFVQGSYAADPVRPGFEAGKPVNPYAAPQGAPAAPRASPFFDDDEEGDFEADDGGYTPPSPGGFVPDSGGGGAAYGDGAPVRGGGPGIQIGGSEKGVIEGGRSRAQPAARVDDEGAAGSKEIITDFNFPDADIMDIAKALGKLTGKNFILDKDVKGRISIVSNSPVTVKDAWRAFLTALDMTNFALIPSGNFIRIARQRDARDKQLKTFTGNYSPDSDALITRLFSLKYLSAEEVARNFRSFMPANSRIIPYEQTNTVIVTDTGSNIAKLAKLLDILDVEGYDAGIEVISVKYASATELSKLIDTLIPGTTANPMGPRFPGANNRFSARRTKEGGIINTIVADDRTNNLIVHANSKGADQVRELVAKLDKNRPAAGGGGGKVHVVYLQFADAEQIAATINNLTSGGSTPARPTGGAGGTGVNPVQATLFEGNIKVAADKSTNSLVITAAPADFSTVQRVINRLDIPRDQVFAEVVIMEITLSRNFNYAANIASPKNGIILSPSDDLLKFVVSPISSTGAILGFKSGGTTNVTVDGKDYPVSNVMGLIKAIQTNTNANVVATPQILTLDNTEATFESAEKIPVLKSVAVNGAISQSADKESVAVSIKIKPQINKLSNFVKLDIDAKLEDFSTRELPSAVASQALATYSRSAKTSVVVADGDTVVMGGLTRDAQNDTMSKIPVLGDIPLLGWLFRSKRAESVKTNLVLFITPKIIRQYEAIRTVLDKKLKERDDFLEKNNGGTDTARDYRDNMIRGLPNLGKLMSEKPQTGFTIDNDEGGLGTISNAKPAGGSAGSPPGIVQPFPSQQSPGMMPPNGGFVPDPNFQANPYAPPMDLPPPPSMDGSG